MVPRLAAKTVRYKAAFADQARTFCALGATDVELAEHFGVAVATLYAWAMTHAEFCAALQSGAAAADERVERSLFQRAVGYSHADVHASSYQGVVTLTPLTKHYPPDTSAAIFWLKNRRRERWRDRQEHEHAGRDGGLIQVDDITLLTPVERKQRLAALLASLKAGEGG